MKKVFTNGITVLASMNNIDKNHIEYHKFYEKEVDDYYRVHVKGNAKIHDSASVSDRATVSDNAIISGNVLIFGEVKISDNATVSDNAIISGRAIVSGNAVVKDRAIISGSVKIRGNATISENAAVYGNMEVTKNVINISNLPYNITITDKHIRIGCKLFTFKEAKELAKTNRYIEQSDYEKMIYEKMIKMLNDEKRILALIKEREKENEDLEWIFKTGI